MTPKETAIAIIESSFGDDLERATDAFANYTDKEMQQLYGQSGMTCQQILDGYKRDRAEREAALEWAKQAN